MKCLGDVVMVMEHKGRDASDGGIILPEGSKQRTYKGSVIAVGPGKPLPDGGRFPMTVRVGDVVAYPERTGDKLKIDGQEMLAIPEQYVICVLVEADVEEADLVLRQAYIEFSGIPMTVDNKNKLATYADGDMIPVDVEGNIIWAKGGTHGH